MIFREEKRNLFEVPESYALAHCISDDCAMGAGIAVEFQKRFSLRSIVRCRAEGVGTCCLYADYKNNSWIRVFNLITKDKYWHKPTYESLTNSLIDMKKQIADLNVKQLAMPKIGCGLDRLQWGKVKGIIQEVFKDLDIEIVVCYL